MEVSAVEPGALYGTKPSMYQYGIPVDQVTSGRLACLSNGDLSNHLILLLYFPDQEREEGSGEYGTYFCVPFEPMLNDIKFAGKRTGADMPISKGCATRTVTMNDGVRKGIPYCPFVTPFGVNVGLSLPIYVRQSQNLCVPGEKCQRFVYVNETDAQKILSRM